MEQLTAWLKRTTFHDAIGVLPYTASATAASSIALVVWKAQQPPERHVNLVFSIGVAAIVAAFAVAWWMGRRRFLSPPAAPPGATSWVLAINAGVLLLVVPVLLLVTPSAASELAGWTWPFLDKRWLIALYEVAIATFVILPVAIESWRTGPDGQPSYPSDATRGPTPRQPRLGRIGGLLAVVALAWFFAGPPWHLERHHRDIESHEQAHLGPLQAVSKGYLPYIGPASTQYGPGSQVLMYGVMAWTGHFDIVSFRTAWALFNFAALLIAGAAAWYWLDLLSAIAVVFLSMFYSPLAFYATAADGTFTGLFGWGNALRYIGPLVVVPMLANLATSDQPRQTNALRRVVVLGSIWGLTSWISQENLSATAMAGGLLIALLCLTRTLPLVRAMTIARNLLAGFACVAIPILLYYAAHGAAGAFLANYVAVPRAVVAGFSNTWWPPHDSARRTLYLTPAFLIAMAVATLWRRPALTLNSPLDPRRARFLAFVCVQLVCYQVALLRSDAVHLQNTMLALPVVLVLGFRDLPAWLSSSRVSHTVVRLAFALLALAIFPSGRLRQWHDILVAPFTRFHWIAQESVATDSRVAYRRATARLSDEPFVVAGSGITMRTFLDFATDVHTLVGTRKTYVGDLGGDLWSGLLSFFADLTPAPCPFDRDTMTINDEFRSKVVEHIRSHPADYECFAGLSLVAPEALAFLDAHPTALRVDRMLGARPVHILLAPDSH